MENRPFFVLWQQKGEYKDSAILRKAGRPQNRLSILCPPS
jgi:hypothetical protein